MVVNFLFKKKTLFFIVNFWVTPSLSAGSNHAYTYFFVVEKWEVEGGSD